MMPYVLFGLALAGLPLLANAIRPIRWQPLSVVTFFAGWLTGELALQHVVWQAALVAGLSAAGALHGWAGWIGLAVAIVDWLGLVYLARAAYRTRWLVAKAMQTEPSIPFETLPGAPSESIHGSGHVQWFNWWRVAWAIPTRGRTIERIKDIDYWGDGRRRHRLDILWSRRKPPQNAPVLIQIHGGAWIVGDKREQGIPLMHELAARGWVCVAINYRLSPKGTWPDHIVDVKRAIAWAKEHIAEYGGDPSWIVLTGGSAGGHLSSLAALTPGDVEWQPGFEDADTSVAACVPFYGVYDMVGSDRGTGWIGQGFLRMLERLVMKTDYASHHDLFESSSPINRVGPDAPPFFVFHGVNDTLVPVEEARRFVTALRDASDAPALYVELPLAQHAFDILVSPRCWSAAAGAVAFLEALRRSRQPLDLADTDLAGSAEAARATRPREAGGIQHV